MVAGILDAMTDVARSGERNPVARRHVEIFNAWRSGYLSNEEMERVCYCEIEKGKRSGDIRTNRYIPSITDSATDEQVRSWRRAECDNNSDKEWLEHLEKFTKAHGLNMGKKESQWYMYIHDGVIGDEVAEYLRIHGDTAQAEPEPELADASV